MKQLTATLPEVADGPAREVARVGEVLERLRQRRPQVLERKSKAEQRFRDRKVALSKAQRRLAALEGQEGSAKTREFERRLGDVRTLLAAYDARMERLREIALKADDGAAAQEELERLEPQAATLADQESALAAVPQEAQEAQGRIEALRGQIATRRQALAAAKVDLEAVACAWDEAPCGEDMREACPHLAAARRARDDLGRLREDDIMALELRLAQAEAQVESLQPKAAEGYDAAAHARLRQRIAELRATLEEAERGHRAKANLASITRQRAKHEERARRIVEEAEQAKARDGEVLEQARAEVQRRETDLEGAKARAVEARQKANYVKVSIKKQQQALKEARATLRSAIYLQQHHQPGTKGAEGGEAEEETATPLDASGGQGNGSEGGQGDGGAD